MTEQSWETGYASRLVAPRGSYGEAQCAANHLSDEGYPVERLSLIGENLKICEQVGGREGHGQATVQGADCGALVRVFFGSQGPSGLIDRPVSATTVAASGPVYGTGPGGDPWGRAS